MSGSRCSSASTFMIAIVHGLGGLNTYIHMQHIAAVITVLISRTSILNATKVNNIITQNTSATANETNTITITNYSTPIKCYKLENTKN